MRQDIICLPVNRVRRNYRGGAGIGAVHGRQGEPDTDCPEEWIGSLVEARNPGMDYIEGEGLTVLADGESLKALVEREPEYYLGDRYERQGKTEFGFLMKLLDSAMRLHVQAHPTALFAREHLNSPYGKLECYVILEVREGIDPYIRLGYQGRVTRQEWKEIIETQDMERMDRLFEKIPVHPGEVWFIPGGMPHAIGEGITMLEVMEPSDLVVRCEFEREGIVVPEEGRFMGRGLEFCLDIFDYQTYSAEEIRRKFCVEPETLAVTGAGKLEALIGEAVTKSFRVLRLTVKEEGAWEYQTDRLPQIGLIFEGTIQIRTENQTVILKKGDSFFMAALSGMVCITNMGTEAAVVGIVSSAAYEEGMCLT